MIIVFSGTDGAGKSTQIEYLNDHLVALGYKTRIIWARGGYTPGMLYIKRLLRKTSKRLVPPAGESSERTDKFKKRHVTYLWMLFSIVDLILLWAVYGRILSTLGYVVIFDRYVDDTYIDFEHNFPKSRFNKMWSWLMLKKLIPIPHYAFLLIVEPRVSLQRSIEKNEPFPDSEQTLLYRFKKYKNNNELLIKNYKNLDTELDKISMARSIVNSIELSLK